MLLCKKCGYQVQHTIGGSLGQKVACTHPDCSLIQCFTAEVPQTEVKQFIEKNCEVLKLENVLDREGKIKDLLWWIRASKELIGSNLANESEHPELLSIASAMEEMIANKAHHIVVTLRPKQND